MMKRLTIILALLLIGAASAGCFKNLPPGAECRDQRLPSSRPGVACPHPDHELRVVDNTLENDWYCVCRREGTNDEPHTEGASDAD